MAVVPAPDLPPLIRSLRRKLRYTQTEMAQILGVKRTRYANWELGVAAPPSEVLAQLQTMGLGLPVSTVREPGASYAPENPLSLPMQPYSPGMVMLRYAGEVPAGDWGDPLASEELHEAPSKYDPARHFVTRVVGYSCYPALQPQDVAIWRRDFSPAFQSVVLAQRKGDHACTVKALEWDPQANRARLVPLNPDSDDVDDCEGWGVIAALVYVFRVVDGVGRTLEVMNPGRDVLKVKDLK